MVNIILLGTKNSGQIVNFLKSKLAEFSEILVFEEDKIYSSGSNPHYFICHKANCKKIELPNAVIIPLDSTCLSSLSFVRAGSVFLLDSALDFSGAPLFENIKVVSCGFKTTDSLTLSSFTEESAVINLQRGLYNFLNEEEAPREFPIKLKQKYDYFYILAVFAVMLISAEKAFLQQPNI